MRRINRKQHKPKFQTGLHHSAAGKRKDDTKYEDQSCSYPWQDGSETGRNQPARGWPR